MINSIQKLLELYAVIFQVFGQVFMAVSSLLTELVPVYVKLLTTLKDDPKYSHLWVRINRIRDLFLELFAEATLLGKDFEVSVTDKNNAGDFEEYIKFSKESESMVRGLQEAFKPVQAKMMEYAEAQVGSRDQFKAWLKSSDKFQETDDAINGPVVAISESELFSIIAEEFNKGDAVEITKEHLESGDEPDMIFDVLNTTLVKREGYIRHRMVLAIEASGSFTYEYDGVRYVVTSFEPEAE
jgi:hypothetical protein